MPRPTFAAPASPRPLVRTAAATGRAALCALALAVSPPAAGAQPFTSLTFFGDSYVDTGNALIVSGGAQPATPPYAFGRFSNGLVFTDYLARALGRPGDAAPAFASAPSFPASGNYAIGGARTDNAQGTQNQVAAYLTRPGGGAADPTGLYTLFVGGNDLRDAGNLADRAARQAAGAAAAQNVLAQAGALAGAGARNVLLFTLASPGALPEALAVPGRSAARDEATAAFNSTLAAGIVGLRARAPGTTFLDFRLDNLFTNLLADARAGGSTYGLTNVTTACLAGFAPPGAASCDVSVFSDGIHPTTRTHQIIAGAVATYVTTGQNVAVVPEPAALALVAGGLAVLGGAAARRRPAA